MARSRVLIAYGTRAGTTAGIAEDIADTLREDGFDVELRPAAEVVSVGPYDAVVLGGAVHANRWHRDARRFAARLAAQLRSRPVWMFSSGPSAGDGGSARVPPVRGARRAMNRTGARQHVTFALPARPRARLFGRPAPVRDPSGDARDTGQVRSWARHIASDLRKL